MDRSCVQTLMALDCVLEHDNSLTPNSTGYIRVWLHKLRTDITKNSDLNVKPQIKLLACWFVTQWPTK